MVFTLGPRSAAAGTKLAAFESIGSTNCEAMARARDGERGPKWYVTAHQTAGRGRRGRPWSAPSGNLATSILEVIDVSPRVAATLGFAAGLALQAALDQVRLQAEGSDAITFRLKWPNDVIAQGRKLAGILLEAEPAAGGHLAVVVGIGTNMVAYPEGTPYPATSLASLGVHTGAEELFCCLSDSWMEYRGIWDNGRGFDAIRRRWLDGAMGLGEPVSIQSGGGVIAGTFDTIDETGCLIVRTAEGKRLPIAAGDVFFGPTASAGAA